MRHDAKQARGKAESERIRLGLGLLTPEERAAQAAAETDRQHAQAREAAKGNPLFEDLT